MALMSWHRLTFGPFELDRESGELYREGARIRLAPQPFRVLAFLAAQAGRVVGREEVREEIWGDTFVDWEAGLNLCTLQIRRALEDDAREPRYLETLPRRGFRFLAPVEVVEEVQQEAAAKKTTRELPPPMASVDSPRARRWPTLGRLLAASSLLAAGFVAGALLLSPPLPPHASPEGAPAPVGGPPETAPGLVGGPAAAAGPILPVETTLFTGTLPHTLCGVVSQALPGSSDCRIRISTDELAWAPGSPSIAPGGRRADYLIEGRVHQDGAIIEIQARLIRLSTAVGGEGAGDAERVDGVDGALIAEGGYSAKKPAPSRGVSGSQEAIPTLPLAGTEPLARTRPEPRDF